jgi:hypothetical protein
LRIIILNVWNVETGLYQIPEAPEDLELADLAQENAPDIWLSKPGGNHYLGISFHSLPHNFPDGHGRLENRYEFSVAPYHLKVMQFSYNSWEVSACLNHFDYLSYGEYWDWLPGVLIVDTGVKYTLPDATLAAIAGLGDYRAFCGLYDVDAYDMFVQKSLELINRLTGPGWAGWPYGQRQLAESVVAWVNADTMLPELLLLTSTRENGAKYSDWNKRLYHPGDILGGWEKELTNTWDCRQALKFLYQSQIMLKDGLPEMALSAAIASLENASAEVLLFLVGNDKQKTDSELKQCRFLDRFDKLLPKYGASLPKDLFEALKEAYLARNGIVHGLQIVGPEKARAHLQAIEDAMVWYWENVGDSRSNMPVDDIPF